ncbi:MAG: hypothetical protein ACOCQ4_00305 [bacterium]
MLLNRIINKTGRIINHHRGWKTNRKIVVIESDDWGSVRTPNLEVYNKLLKNGLHVDRCRYHKYDSLASADDFSLLYNVLSQVKDKNGNPPVFTANTVVANPDFTRIRESDFEQYFYEDFRVTLSKYPRHNFNIWQEGIDKNLFIPQFHGREHLNINRWLELLKSGNKKVHLAFNYGLFGLNQLVVNENIPNLAAALEAKNTEEIKQHNNILTVGIKMFNDIFSYSSKSFIAPNYIWHKDHEQTLYQNKIKYLQGVHSQFQPTLNNKLIYKPHYLGQKNNLGQEYLIRNCTFEPSSFKKMDWVDSCLKEIEIAFNNHRPAIICSHRVNFVGYINNSNRDKNLSQLHILFTRLINKWPDVEFMSTPSLGKLINNTIN